MGDFGEELGKVNGGLDWHQGVYSSPLLPPYTGDGGVRVGWRVRKFHTMGENTIALIGQTIFVILG